MTCERHILQSKSQTMCKMPHERTTCVQVSKSCDRSLSHSSAENPLKADSPVLAKTSKHDFRKDRRTEKRISGHDSAGVCDNLTFARTGDNSTKNDKHFHQRLSDDKHVSSTPTVLVTSDNYSSKQSRSKEEKYKEKFAGKDNSDLCIQIDSLDISKSDQTGSEAGSCTDISDNRYLASEGKGDNSSVDLSELDTEDSSLEESSETDSVQPTPSAQTTAYAVTGQQSPKGKYSKKRRLRNLIPVLRRSQSVGCESQLVPEHALFLEHSQSSEIDKEKGQETSSRHIVHKTCSADAAMMAADLLSTNPQEYMRHKQKSSIARNVREKLQKLKRRNTDSLLGVVFLGVRGTVRISQADALEWATSFESLLTDKNGLEMFRDFLKSEFSEENIEFWIACEEFKSIRTNRLIQQAHKIYSEFIAIKAPKQVNLDSKTRLDTIANLENPTRDTFKEAQKRIQFLMENDSYKRFLESEPYRTLIGKNSAAKDT